MAIWVTSDLHLNDPHAPSIASCRFSSVREHDAYVIRKYNEIVTPDDVVYILGDLGFTPKAELKPLVSSLHGRKILIIGNHDQLNDEEYKGMGVTEIIRHPVYYSGSLILSHIPVKECYKNPWVCNAHGHLHTAGIDIPNYCNVNIEVNNFAPQDLRAIQEWAAARCIANRFQKFGTEWYAQWENKKIG